MTERVQLEWARRVAAEYRSAAVAAQALTWGIQVGLPPDLLTTATRIVTDELEHAALSHGCLSALGGEAVPVDLRAEQLEVPGLGGPFASLTSLIVHNFCLGETLAVPLFAAMRARATHPATRPALDRILLDEAVHRAFGWDTLDALLPLDPGLPTWIAARLPTLLSNFEGYRAPPGAPPLSAAERACGLLDHEEYAEIFAATWREDIVPRFERRGIGVGAC